MANLIFSKHESAVINSGRVQVSYNGNDGDTFAMLIYCTNKAAYNAVVTAYNDLEQQIDDTTTAGFSCFGTDQDDIKYPVYSKPARPKPTTK